MARVKRIVLDVLKPHQPNTLEFARAIAASGESYQVDIQVLRTDRAQVLVLETRELQGRQLRPPESRRQFDQKRGPRGRAAAGIERPILELALVHATSRGEGRLQLIDDVGTQLSHIGIAFGGARRGGHEAQHIRILRTKPDSAQVVIGKRIVLDVASVMQQLVS